jgi:ABC-type nitrate/sulfonate/bicarbonate transport system substrate-binding protein
MRRILVGALAALLAVAPAACDGDQQKTEGGLTTVRVGTQPYYDYQFFSVAHELGVDREFGLDLVTVAHPGQTAYAQLARGDLDITASCESCLLPAIENLPGVRNFLITNLFKGFVLIGRSQNGKPQFTTYAETLAANGNDPEKAKAAFVRTLRGRNFAINPAADGALLGALLAHGGLTSSDVRVTSFPDEVKAALAFIAGTGDYYFGSLPQELRMLTADDLKTKFVEAGPAELFPLNYANFAAMSGWLENNEDTAVKLVAIWFRVTRYLDEKPERVLGIIARTLQAETGGVLSDEQTRLALTRFMYFAPYDKAQATYFDPSSPTRETLALEELYRQARADKQIPATAQYADYEVSARYFTLLTGRTDLIQKINAPLS